MRDPILHLDFPSDFDELCAVADQCQSVGIDHLAEDLRRVTHVQSRMALAGHLPPSTLRSLGDFNDLS